MGFLNSTNENAYGDYLGDYGANDACMTYLPFIYSSAEDGGKREGYLCEKISKEVRLSWILLDTWRDKTVSLSTLGAEKLAVRWILGVSYPNVWSDAT